MKTNGLFSKIFSGELDAIYAAGTNTKSNGIIGVITLVSATVDPFFPAPSNRILFNIGGKLHRAQTVPNTSGQYLSGRNPSSCKDNT